MRRGTGVQFPPPPLGPICERIASWPFSCDTSPRVFLPNRPCPALTPPLLASAVGKRCSSLGVAVSRPGRFPASLPRQASRSNTSRRPDSWPAWRILKACWCGRLGRLGSRPFECWQCPLIPSSSPPDRPKHRVRRSGGEGSHRYKSSARAELLSLQRNGASHAARGVITHRLRRRRRSHCRLAWRGWP